MTNPWKCVDVVVTIESEYGASSTIGVVESMTVELEHEGGVEHVYGTTRGKHAVGGDRATFTVRRHFRTDSDPDLFYDLFAGKLPFGLAGEISGISNSKLTLSDCLAYRYRPVYGAPNDKVGEEISGESTTWISEI